MWEEPTVIKKTPVFIIFIGMLIAPNFADATYFEDDTIVILRSQFVDDPSITVNGVLSESFWNEAGLLSVKFTGAISADVDVLFRFINDDSNLYLGFTIFNMVYEDISLTIYFDADNNGVLSVPEDAKSISTSKNSSINLLTDMFWDGTVWTEDQFSSVGLYSGSSNKITSQNQIDFEMRIPLISSDIVYDGLQIPSTSNSYVGLSFQITADLNNGTVETFEFPTSPTDITGYIDFKLAGPEDKDLPSYVPPVQVTTSIVVQTSAGATVDETQAAFFGEDSASPFPFGVVFASLLVLPILIKRRR
ncbi:MAG: hypothetical protein IH840_18260 [Candidatus Heimdallarchaeota archaeon]|nr:hypothetical protein [Candidatus Heimdallarchaeota archaeon]